jgi:hypothetical protein
VLFTCSNVRTRRVSSRKFAGSCSNAVVTTRLDFVSCKCPDGRARDPAAAQSSNLHRGSEPEGEIGHSGAIYTVRVRGAGRGKADDYRRLGDFNGASASLSQLILGYLPLPSRLSSGACRLHGTSSDGSVGATPVALLGVRVGGHGGGERTRTADFHVAKMDQHFEATRYFANPSSLTCGSIEG